MSRPYVAQDDSGGWYGDCGGVMQDPDPKRTREQALEWSFERLIYIADRNYTELESEMLEVQAVINAARAWVKHIDTDMSDDIAAEILLAQHVALEKAVVALDRKETTQ
jgi:hypothetical protein